MVQCFSFEMISGYISGRSKTEDLCSIVQRYIPLFAIHDIQYMYSCLRLFTEVVEHGSEYAKRLRGLFLIDPYNHRRTGRGAGGAAAPPNSGSLST